MGGDLLREVVSQRLDASITEFKIGSNKALADLLGTTPSCVGNWKSKSGNLPRVPEMMKLRELTGVTLDWLCRGHIGSIDPKLALRLKGT